MENLNLLADTAVHLLQDGQPFGLIPRKKRRFGRRLPANPFTEPKQQHVLSEIRLNSKRKFNADGKENEIRAKKIKKFKVVPLPAFPVAVAVAVPVEVRRSIEARKGTEIKLVIQKMLFRSDLDKVQNRLSMPVKKARGSFLEGEEESKMKEGMSVKVLEPCGKESEMTLKKWKMNKRYNYVLIAGSRDEGKVCWIEVVEREENRESGVFEEGNLIRVWSFRDVSGNLCLTIEKVADDQANNAFGIKRICL